ncbi:MAG: FliH/SctL family protein [Sporomusaceae bacterium]|nr:FliH/SctL family protein [Sporomusaceae bacterium]
MSKIIKQVKVHTLPVVIDNLCLAVPEPEPVPVVGRITRNEPAAPPVDLLAVQVEIRVAAAVEQAKREMEAQAAAFYEESKQKGYNEGRDEGYAAGKAAGYDEGKAAGQREGFEQGQAEVFQSMEAAVDQAIAEAARIMSEANRQAGLSILAAQQQILEIALAVAEKILAAEIERDSQVVVAVIKQAMDKVRDQPQITVRVNPADFAAAIAVKPELEAILQREQSVEFASDQTVGCGGCVIDSAFGAADARIETQLEAIRTLLRGTLS